MNPHQNAMAMIVHLWMNPHQNAMAMIVAALAAIYVEKVRVTATTTTNANPASHVERTIVWGTHFNLQMTAVGTVSGS